MDALRAANAQLQERFSPELNRRAGEYLARLTGDQYTAISLNRDRSQRFNKGTMRLDGHVRGHVSGYVDGEFKGVIHGSVDALIESKYQELQIEEQEQEDQP